MTSQCPRCAAPRLGDYPFCHQCGFDFRQPGGPAMPPQQALPPQQPIYGAPPKQGTYNPPPAPYYYQPQVPQQPNPWASPWPSSAQPMAPLGQPAEYQTSTPGSYAPDDAATPAASAGMPTATGAAPATEQSTPDQAAAWQPQATPSVCLRCYAPLHPGYSHCSNCGFDNSVAWGAPMPVGGGRIPVIAYALALLGGGLIVAAVALLLVAAR